MGRQGVGLEAEGATGPATRKPGGPASDRGSRSFRRQPVGGPAAEPAASLAVAIGARGPWEGAPLSTSPPPGCPACLVPAGGSGRVLGTAGRDAPLILARSGQGATAERSRARCFSGLPGVAAGGPWCPRLSWMPAGLPFHTQLPAVLSHSSCCVRPPSAAPALAGPPERGLCHPPAPAAGFPARGARACLPADPRAQTPRSSLLVWRPRVPGAA